MEEANKLIGTGKKHLVMGNVVEAVNVLQEACGMLGKKYGDTADECGEAFFWCGKALLDLARMENTVLGNALEGVPEEEEEKPKDSNIESTENVDEKTRDELRVQVYDAMAEKKSGDAEEAGEKSEDAEKKDEAGDAQQSTAKEEGGEKEQLNGRVNGSDKTEDKKENEENAVVEKESTNKQEESADKPEGAEAVDGEEEEEGGDDDSEMEGDAEGDEAEVEDDAEGRGEGDATAEKDSDDEEVGNLQLAWEMLEVAKVIYKRKETKEDQLMAAQAHLKLGEVSSESGNYAQALEDFQECLSLQQKHLESDSRLLAETHYQLGLTYGLNCQYRQAIEQLNSSISAIKSRLDKLQEVIDKAEGPEALPEERKEMEELKALLPEIQEKVEDATEGLKTASTDAEAMKDVLVSKDGVSTSSACPGSSVQNGDAPTSSAIAAKSTNGVSSANGHVSTAPVSDISHLVRKKRKPEDSPVKAGALKKVKQEEPHTNGVHNASGDAAGHTNNMEVASQ